MGVVTKLSQHKNSKKTHINGTVMCTFCSHKWQAVFPTGTLVLVCPQCNLEKGVLREFIDSDKPVLVCTNCFNSLFMFRQEDKGNPMCVNCGILIDREDTIPPLIT